MSQRVAVVTGSNKGIGFAIVKGLAPKFDGVVYLTARNEELGRKAVQELEKENIKVQFHQLDIDNQQSIDRFAKYIKEKHGGLDLLINNAAIAIFLNRDPSTLVQDATDTIRVNYTGTLNVCKAFFPLLRPHARVVNVASRLGMLKYIKDQKIVNRLKSDDLTEAEIDGFIHQYIELLKTKGSDSDIMDNTYGSYSFSKVILNALTRVQHRQLSKDSRADLVINSCCPGYVATDLNHHMGKLTTEQGAETPLLLALLPPNYDGPKGVFWADKEVLEWANLNWVPPTF